MPMERRSSKKVRFAESLDRTLVYQSLLEHVQKDVVSVDPRRSCRREAKMQKPKGYGVLLRGSFLDPEEECQRNIIAFVQLGEQDFSRGIERHLSPRHKQERDANTEKVLKAVLDQQKANYIREATYDEAASSLRFASVQHSGVAQVFARRFGVADEYVVKYGEDPSAALTQIDRMKQSNAKKALRQPSSKLLNTSIRDMACEINARKACRQASVRNLNTSIKKLALSRPPSQRNIAPSIAASKNARKACRQPSIRELNSNNISDLASNSEAAKEPAKNAPGHVQANHHQRVAIDCERYLNSALELLDENDQFLMGSTRDNKNTKYHAPTFHLIRG